MTTVTTEGADWDKVYWRALIEGSRDVVLIVDTSGTVLFVNRVAPVYAARGGVVGKKIWEFGTGDAETRLKAKLAEVVETRAAVLYENPGMRVDGTPGWYEVRAIPVIVDGEVERVFWATTDISDRKRLEEQLGQAQKMEAIGLLAGGVAHDFNNLLAVIMGFSDMANHRLPPDHPIGEHLREITDAARRGGELTRRLLAFSRRQIIKPQLVDLGAALTHFARMIRRVLGEDIELSVHEPLELVTVRADPVQLEQVLMNLCMNARQAMPDGGVLRLLGRAVTLDDGFVRAHAWARAGSFAEIAVTDAGTGMDEATLARVFEPFFTTKREGTGLGLSTVHGIVEQHHGFLHVTSALGEGTTVRAYLPQAGDAIVRERALSHPRELEARGGSELILVAEDEAPLRALVVRTLQERGYRVIEAHDGEDAVRQFERRAQEISLAVLDVVMPRLDARQVYERIRAVRPDVRVLFTTGYAPDSTRLAELLATTEIPLLEKPFTGQSLAFAVRNAIDAPVVTPSPSA